jgi:hypothetical protein
MGPDKFFKITMDLMIYPKSKCDTNIKVALFGVHRQKVNYFIPTIRRYLSKRKQQRAAAGALFVYNQLKSHGFNYFMPPSKEEEKLGRNRGRGPVFYVGWCMSRLMHNNSWLAHYLEGLLMSHEFRRRTSK